MPEQDYDYSYDENDAYLYSGTDVLVNNFGIKDRKELSEIERAITGARIAEIDIHPILGCFDLDHLCAIHKALFEGVYPWAGKIRTRGFISKGNSLFCAPEFIVSYSDDLFGKLNEDATLKNCVGRTSSRRWPFIVPKSMLFILSGKATAERSAYLPTSLQGALAGSFACTQSTPTSYVKPT